jgi:acyl-coenzyme A thioesterase PaaI-like protein
MPSFCGGVLNLKKAIQSMMNLIYKHPGLFKFGLSWWAPFLGTGISIKDMASDYSYVTLQMKQRWYNRNAFGTHFGGSLYAMCDPFFALLLVARLGKNYYVWDKAAQINFVKPGKGTVTAHFDWTQAKIDDIIAQAANGQAIYPKRTLQIHNAGGEIVATLEKTMYVKKRS